MIPLDILNLLCRQRLKSKLDIVNQAIAATLAELFAHHDTHHAHLLTVRCHRVRGDNPAAFAELVGECEFIEEDVLGWTQAEGYYWKAVAGTVAHDDESLVLELVGEVVGRVGQVVHDVGVASAS